MQTGLEQQTSSLLSSAEKRRLWDAADILRGHMDAAEYKHVVLGLIFLKHLSDTFDEKHAELQAEADEGADPEDKDEYVAVGLFWVPPEARWSVLRDNARQPAIGTIVDDAMAALERENPSLKGVLPKQYGLPSLDKGRLGDLINTFTNLTVGGRAHASRDVLGQVYEYFLAKFASAEGKQGGEFYTPASVVRVLVEMLAPYRGRVYDPCCGSGGMFVQSERFVEEHQGRIGDISIYGQELNYTTWKLAKMNLAIRGIEANLGTLHADTFHNDLHPDLRADYVLANPPFNISQWGGDRLRDDRRWRFGAPPPGNANYAWVQHIIHHLAPDGVAGFVLANGSLSTNTGGEGEIRKCIVEADLVDCIVAMPGQLFYSTQIPVSLWFLARNRANGRGQDGRPLRDRTGEILFIDARALGELEDRTHRILTDAEIARIAGTYHAWRSLEPEVSYGNIDGFARAARVEEIVAHGYVLTPSRYVGASDYGDDPNASESIARRANLIRDARRLLVASEVVHREAEQSLEEFRAEYQIDNWHDVTVGNVARVIGGGTPPSQDDRNFGGDIPWITPKDLTTHQGRYIAAGARSLTEVGLANSSAKLLPTGAVLVSSRAPIGLVAIASRPVTTNQGIRSLVFDETQDPVFWYYLLRQSTAVLDAHANGSTFREISGGSIAKLTFKLPSLESQRRLAAMLGRLDSLIEHNLELNKVMSNLTEKGSRLAVRRPW